MSYDLISRQAAIDAVSEGCQEWRGIFERCEEKLLALPPAQPEPSQIARDICTILENEQDMRVILKNAQSEQLWIPCSERLPKEDSDILVTYFEKDEKRIVPVNYGRETWFDCVFDRALNPVGVLAWMPLPEPYKAESEDKE